MARVLIAQRETGAAARLLERLVALVQTAGLAGDAIEGSLLLSLTLSDQGQVPQAMQALARALSLAERTGYVYAIVAEGPATVALLSEFAGRGSATPFVHELRELAQRAASGRRSETGPAGLPAGRSAALLEPLTPREEEVLRLTAAGLSVPEIAANLVIASGTVHAHLKSIYRKLEIHNRVQAAEAARRLGLL
jgi:LuxR family maltose regulon positive regulatory protein